MRLLFCSDPLNSRQTDPAFGAEVAAAESLGLPTASVDFEALVNEGDPQAAVRRVPKESTPTLGLYRGWMLKPQQYGSLYDALLEKGIRLINDPQQYLHCHHLPESYALIEGHTPKSVWLRIQGEVSIDAVM